MAVADCEPGAMARRDFAHDGEPEAATRAWRAGNTVKTVEHALALRGWNARPFVFDLEVGMAVPLPGSHGDARAARRVLERVVQQVGERLAQQELVAAHACGLQVEAEVEVALQGPV